MNKIIKKRILVVFGTRPEAIKLAPLILELKKNNKFFDTKICVTAQHREMLDQVLELFNIIPDIDLNVMVKNQSLFDISSKILSTLEVVINDYDPDLLIVHGDTTTAFITSLAAFYSRKPLAHIEAGLRTNDINSPYPEEFNRQAISLTAKYHFSPTQNSRDNLIKENRTKKYIFVTGNTAIDLFKYTITKNYINPFSSWINNDRFIILTIHRRENLGKNMKIIFNALLDIVQEYKIKVIFPVHLNPIIKAEAEEILGENKNIILTSPLNVFDFHNLLNLSYFVITDSGGIQEEAPHLNKPVLVLRNSTERVEGIKSGTLKLVDLNTNSIKRNIVKLLLNRQSYNKMAMSKNPYGNGNASKKIIQQLKKIYFDLE